MRNKIKAMCRIALGGAILCLISPWAVPAGGVPISLSLLAMLLISTIFPWRTALGAVIVYVALGTVGIPVFAGFAGGFQVIVGPTGGFILSYPIIAFLVSRFKGNFTKNIILGFISAIICYVLGSLWFSFTTNTIFLSSLTTVVVSCIIPDTAKIICAAILADLLKTRLEIKE